MSSINVTEARFRPATPEEVNHAKGGIGWRCLNTPWNYFVKTWATVGLVYQIKVKKKDINPYEWKESLPLRVAHYVKWGCGLAPETEFLETVTNFKGTWHLLNSQEAVFKAFFSQNRKSEVFSGSQAFHALLSLIAKTFPETTFDPEDFMFTSTPEKNGRLHRLVQRFVSGIHVHNNLEFIRKEAHETLQRWANACNDGSRINITKECRVFASKIISKLVFGMTDNNAEVADAVSFINAYILRRELKRTLPDDEDNLMKALAAFKDAVNKVLDAYKAPLFETKDDDERLSLAEKQAMAFSIFFAGQETVASLMTYIFHVLGTNHEYQWSLIGKVADARNNMTLDLSKQTFMQDLFARGIREFPPAYGVSRMTEVDTCLEFKLEGDDETTHKHIFYAGERITAMMSNFAKVNSQMDRSLYWLPFGFGPHRCPGEQLAKTEILEFLAIALEHYYFSSNSSDPNPKQGLVTLQLRDDVILSVTNRKNSPYARC